MSDPNQTAGLLYPCPLCDQHTRTPRMRIVVNERDYWVHIECANGVVRIAIMRKLDQREL